MTRDADGVAAASRASAILPDSPAAVARVLALTMMADTRVHPGEVDVLRRLDARRAVGLEGDDFVALVGRCLEERLACARAGEAPHLVDDAAVEAALDAIPSHEKRLLTYRLVVELLPADGDLHEVELALLQKLLDRWNLRHIAARHGPP